ncbi:sigma-70 family RNA polymerase sigma factor [Gloeothece verrucosa]|uniref:RNA polymerase, sigma 32 subunit, RpoH n=1 Tax=Gloeothece verrucosa (strain PCC 7822) TaxID=497965 RepID=E0UM34_GLOV7|nr:sigma-70 family RNA polymerase sigma factor [Gloeothece verrucosa]ADN18014.1 RNA polymerase, sigma 32 subunit, RpoH [Gloeothece verrucosa PCC 7822]
MAPHPKASRLDSYFQSFNSITLLDNSQPIELGHLIQKWQKLLKLFHELGQQYGSSISPEQFCQHYRLSKAEYDRILYQGKKAADTLVRANLKFVIFIANRYVGRGLELSDLIQEGSLGLIRAAERFDPSLGYQFSTYANWWVRAFMTRALANQSRTIRLPSQVNDKLNKIKKTRHNLAQLLGRSPSSSELAQALGISVLQLHSLAQLDKKTISLSVWVDEQGRETLQDLIPSSDEPSLDETLKPDEIEQLLQTLSPRNQEIVRLRILEGKTLSEIGQSFHLSRERVRKICLRSLTILRQNALDKLMI